MKVRTPFAYVPHPQARMRENGTKPTRGVGIGGVAVVLAPLALPIGAVYLCWQRQNKNVADAHAAALRCLGVRIVLGV